MGPAQAMEGSAKRSVLSPNQRRSFWAAWGGSAMDGMDSVIYSLILFPALQELLPKSGIPATVSNIGFYGGLLFALFMIGWGFAVAWGPVADHFGRVRTMMLSILWFSVFTFLGAVANNIWTLAVFRFLAGVGIGGEWAVGASLVAEDWPEERRTMGAALMHTGYYCGFLFAAIANYGIGGHFGWRSMFAFGGAPALFIAYLRSRVEEPARWETKLRQLGEGWTMKKSFMELFSPKYRRRTILNSAYMIVSLAGLWAGVVYVPTAITYLAQRAGSSTVEAERLASYSTALIGIATVLTALIVPFVANRLGRRATQAILFAIMFVFVGLAFGHIFYMSTDALPWFMVCTFFLGIGGANFIVYSFWLPEQYGTECRASAFAFTANFGRFAAAGFTFLVGAGIRHFHTLGMPVAAISAVFLVGIFLLLFGEETKGKPLPA